MPDEGTPLRIGTRASELALRQARIVQGELAARGVASDLVTFTTVGDKKLDQPLSAIGATGLFTKELEEALRRGHVECCVHSLKDLPTASASGLVVAATLEREDPRDVLVVNDAVGATGLHDLPRGSRVGTSSLRRRAQLLALRSDVEVVELRGNVPTRLHKVDDGQVHAAILAAAGLLRLGAAARIAAYLEPPAWLPAAGQGAIAVQVRADDERLLSLVASLSHAPTALATAAERALLAALDGGCQVPIGALAIEDLGGWVLHGLVADLRGRRVVRGRIEIDPSSPGHSGKLLADDLRERGGGAILEGLRGMEKLPKPQPE